MQRRTFLRSAGASLSAFALRGAPKPPSILLDPLTQPKFVNPLPIPGVLTGTFHNIAVTQFQQDLGLINPASGQRLKTTVWGYNGSYPGPTILARRNQQVSVNWHNHLRGLPHLLPVDSTLHWANPTGSANITGYVPLVSHLHGGHTEWRSDGHPDAWFTPDNRITGPLFTPLNTYANDQEAATLWYHDHALGITRLNVYAGLAGFYLLKDDNEDYLVANRKLPAAQYDIGLAIQDRMFTADGQLYYPADPPTPTSPTPSALPEFFGDHMLVNGMAWPYLAVEPRQYRFRLLNGCDSRFLTLFASSGQPFYQVGTDDGLMNSPVPLSQLTLGPGERADVVMDFSGLAGQTVVIRNHAKTPFPKGTAANPQSIGQVMAFRVTKPLSAIPQTTLPSNLRPLLGPIQPLGAPAKVRSLLLFEGMDEYGRINPLLGTTQHGALHWSHPVTETPKLNTVEYWDVYNATVDGHPIHLHLVAFQILSRQKFSATQDMHGALSNIRHLGQPKPPEDNERGWKDTAQMFPGEVTRIAAKFDRPGNYVWHCHILSHEDHEMMRPFRVD